jgi:hypothetical protein
LKFGESLKIGLAQFFLQNSFFPSNITNEIIHGQEENAEFIIKLRRSIQIQFNFQFCANRI